MQLLASPPKSGNMAQPTDHGGLYYTELIKSNLQFIYGKDCFLEILSQVKAPDTWQVSVLKTEDGLRSVAFFDSGAGLLNVLEKLHRKSAEMLSKFISDNAADATAYVKRKRAEAEAEAAAAVNACVVSKADKRKDGKGAEKPSAVDAVKETSLLSLASAGSDSENSSDDGASWVGNLQRKKLEFYGKRSSQEVPRSIICPNYGPVSAFYRSQRAGHDTMRDDLTYLVDRKPNSQATEAVESSKPEQAADAASAPGLAESKSQPENATAPREVRMETMSAAARMQYDHQMKYRQRNPVPPARSSVLLYIQWNGYGETVVADECHLSVRAVQSRVRHMLRTHGPGLFGEAYAHAMTPVMFTPEELVNFVVTVKGMRVNDALVILGPGFGDDLSSMIGSLQPSKAIRIEIDLKWNGKLLNTTGKAAVAN
ncbi:hypothetical protein V8C37DRAFT_373471 [Trichoderma ceciliae]